MTLTPLRWSTLPLALLFSIATTLTAGDWPTFRGPHRADVTPNAKLLQEWPADGPKVVWEAAGAGRGYASVCIQGNKFYLLGDGISTKDGDKDEYLTAYDLKTGKQLWATNTGKAWNEGPQDWQSSRGTPTVDGDRVFAITPHGQLIAANTADGKIEWQKDLVKDLKGKKGDPWGFGESPTVDGDRLICTPGAEATMVALNKKTGDLIWTCVRPGDRGAGHASIVTSQIAGKKVFVQTTGGGAMGVSDDGTLLWSFPIDSTTAVIPTPIVRENLVFFAAGYGRGGALLKQVPNDKGGVDVETIYGLNPKLGNKHGGVVLVGDHLYGDSDDSGVPFCANLMTGEQSWKSRGVGGGSAAITSADNKLYIQWANGNFALVDAKQDGYHEISHFKIPGSGGPRPSWAHPVILDGKLYVRQDDKVICYDIAR